MASPEPGFVQVFDTTLRDGTQREGISLSCDDKIRIAKRLDTLGVAFIEGGWPGSNPKDVEFFQRAAEIEWKTAKIVAFGSTRRAGVDADADVGLRAQLKAETEVCTLFGKSWTMQVTEVLRTTLDENLAMIEESVGFLREHGRRVIYDAEHFFDGYRADPEYAVETLRAALKGGAETLSLCDTNGGSLPWEVGDIVTAVREALGEGHYRIGVHCHDDTGCGVANTLAAVRAGARHVQGTINGYGERCGNANLCSVIPDIELKLGLRCLPEGQLAHLYDLAHFVADIANLHPNDHQAYVGRSAFAHKGGVHVSAMRRNADAYQHCTPELVGNQMRVVVSELSGRSNLLSKAEELGVDVQGGSEQSVLERIKAHEAEGCSYEAAEASVALMLRREDPSYRPRFELIDYKAFIGHRAGHEPFAEATVKARVLKNGGDETQLMLTAAEGDGPVEALDHALRKALEPLMPELSKIHLTDYKVRILDGRTGTSAITRVLIDMSDGEHEWSTVGASSNIIEASCRALVDGIEYGLLLARDELAQEKKAS